MSLPQHGRRVGRIYVLRLVAPSTGRSYRVAFDQNGALIAEAPTEQHGDDPGRFESSWNRRFTDRYPAGFLVDEVTFETAPPMIQTAVRILTTDPAGLSGAGPRTAELQGAITDPGGHQ